jgi:hypothetical protein
MKLVVEWLCHQTELDESTHEDIIWAIKKSKKMEKQRMIDLVQYLKDYTRESNNILGFVDREASEFVEIFLKQQEL